MKRPYIQLLSLAFAALILVMTSGCERIDIAGTDGPEKDYYYNLYTEYQNCNASTFDGFAPLWDVNEQGDEVVWTRTYHGTRQACDQLAVEAFDQILALIDDNAVCSNLHEDDYMTATMQRVEGGPHDLKTKTWTSQGVR